MAQLSVVVWASSLAVYGLPSALLNGWDCISGFQRPRDLEHPVQWEGLHKRRYHLFNNYINLDSFSCFQEHVVYEHIPLANEAKSVSRAHCILVSDAMS